MCPVPGVRSEIKAGLGWCAARDLSVSARRNARLRSYLVRSETPQSFEIATLYEIHEASSARTPDFRTQMPRPKVPPENRIRGYRACNPCKASKIRCDSQLPCANCTKRSRVASCTYSITSSSSNATRRSTRGKQPHHGILPLPETVPLSPAISTAAADSRRFSFAEPAASPGQSSHARSAADISGPFNSSHLDQEDASGPTTVGPTVPADDDQDSPQEHFVTGPNGETRELLFL